MNNIGNNMSRNTLTNKIAMFIAVFVLMFGAFNMGGFESTNILTPTFASATVLTPPPLPPPVVRTCDVKANVYEIVAGADLVISWTTQGFSKYTLNGESVSGPNGSKTFKNIQENSTYTLVAATDDGNYDCTVSVTVKCLPVPVPVPTCTLNPETKLINSGDSVDLVWTTTNAASASLTDFGSVALNGSKNTGPLTANKNYTLTVLGNNGDTVTCHSAITVKDEPKFCKLELIKSVAPISISDLTKVKPGDELLYSIKIKNTGTADCTGGGVKILDIHDSWLTFISATQSSNLSAGYNSQPLYTPSTRTIAWNGHVLNPGEEGTITWKAKVNPLTCGTTRIIKNTAKATAYELNNFTTWIQSNTVETLVTAEACEIPAPTCTLNPANTTIDIGGSVNLTWTTTNAASASLTDFGSVALNGSKNTGALTNSKTYTLTVLGNNGSSISCHAVVNVKDKPVSPTCDSFTANPIKITKGDSSTLAWSTSNGSRVVIDNGIGEVSATGTHSVSPLATIEYTLKVYGTTAAISEVSCKAKVTVEEPVVTPLPVCTSFTASPNSLPVEGGNTTLTWTTKDAVSASISPAIGAVSVNGSTTVALSTSTIFTLNVVGLENKTVSCTVPVTVAPPVPVPFTCSNNVSLNASPTSIRKGNTSVITWSTTGVDSLSFNSGITSIGLSGSVTVSPTDSTTYVLTAKKGNETISCPVAVEVTTGGGGGGSVSPTCELSVSANNIKSGEQVTLRWDSRNASNLELVDSFDKIIVTTKDKLSTDKKEYFDGSIKVSPRIDTTYILTVERGSRDEVCKVNVKVGGSGGITQIRDQQPLVSGISLTQVPYTGFAAGPIMTMAFYLLLLAWALYLAYVLVIKRDIIGGYRLVGNHTVAPELTPEQIRPDVFVSSVRSPAAPSVLHTKTPTDAPANLPVSSVVIGYDQSPIAKQSTPKITNNHITDETVTALENHAHAKRALLSSDAIRHLIGTTDSFDSSIATLNEVILEAKSKYPSEDGWVVINEKRMRELCLTCSVRPEPSSVAPYVPTVIPEGSGSLAEAIVTGNIVAAYEMIGHRPMFALADAAADMDSVLRARRGGKEVISEMLLNTTRTLTEDQVVKIIEALTGALDGTYTDEASAVKMAIMKAVKVVA